MYRSSKYIIAVLLIACYCYAAAQKLPAVQQTSLRAPVDVKIDGKATEWNNTFQAYNRAVDVFYTIANDDDNLYLIVKASKPRIVEKILHVGVTFFVNNTAIKSDKAYNNVVITFPDVSVADGQYIITTAGIKSSNGMPALRSDSVSARADSLISAVNKLLTAKANTINLKGIKEIPDSAISVYNEEKIKAAAAFDIRGGYTYELAIPLKYLGLKITDDKKFSYSIKLLSRLNYMKKGTAMVYRYDKNGDQYDANQDLDSTTDFWGEYTLARK
jgi:hypothetical protein